MLFRFLSFTILAAIKSPEWRQNIVSHWFVSPIFNFPFLTTRIEHDRQVLKNISFHISPSPHNLLAGIISREKCNFGQFFWGGGGGWVDKWSVNIMYDFLIFLTSVDSWEFSARYILHERVNQRAWLLCSPTRRSIFLHEDFTQDKVKPPWKYRKTDPVTTMNKVNCSWDCVDRRDGFNLWRNLSPGCQNYWRNWRKVTFFSNEK